MLLTIGPDNTTGYRKHLEGIAKIAQTDAKYLKIRTRNSEALAEIQSYNPKLTIIGGRNWIIRNQDILDHISGEKGILYCSPAAQAEISGEEIRNLNIYLKLLETNKINYLFTGSKDLAATINRETVIYMPAPLTEKQYVPPKEKMNNDVALLSNHSRHKNIINAMAAFSKSKADKLILNGGLKENIDFLHNVCSKSRFENYGLLNDGKFTETLQKSKLLLHPSHSEGFCYTVFESFLNATPAIVTKAVDWFYNDLLTLQNPVDIEEIKEKIDTLVDMNSERYISLVKNCQTQARIAAKENNRIVLKTLKELL